MELVGRRVERQVLDQLLDDAHAGRSGALVVRGPAGVGKTALLEHARSRGSGSGFREIGSVGVQSETPFTFGGLHQLCAPLLDRLAALPEPQRLALGVALGQDVGAPPDRFLIGLAVLNLLAETAEDAPLLCLVDDAQWWDEGTAQVMAFVARRLAAERIAVVVGVRDADHVQHAGLFGGLPEIRLEGLAPAEARALLDAAVTSPLDRRVRDRVLAEARGNPLALLELPRSASPEGLAGGFALPDAMSVPRRVEEMFQRRWGDLPGETQLMLLVAAAEPTGDVELLWRAAGHLGIPREATAPAEIAGLLTVDGRVRFRHPLVRSAIYLAATPPDRRRVHGALAVGIDERADPDRLAWHRAQAVRDRDESVADQLTHAAGRARARGGLAAAAAFLHRAVDLTPSPGDRARRALEAALAKHEAGASETALELLALARSGPLDPTAAARVELLDAEIGFHLTRDPAGPARMVAAARSLGPDDVPLARDTYLQALDDALVLGGGGAVGIAESALAAPAPPVARPSDLLLDGVATSVARGFVAGAPLLRRALEAFRDSPTSDLPPDHPRRDQDKWLWLAGRHAVAMLDDDHLHALATRNAQQAREQGALSALPAALSFLSIVSVLRGDLTRAAGLAAESTAITEDTGGVLLLHAHVILSGWRGDEQETDRLSAETAADPDHPDEGTEIALSQYARAVLHNGLGNYARARDAAARACESYDLSLSSAGLPELVEACVRSGDPVRAQIATREAGERAEATGTSWAHGLALRCRALTTTGPDADRLYAEAVERLRDCSMPVYLARTHLVHGEWLRREGRRQDAREQLRTAYEMLTEMGTEGFAARAARELRATGEQPRRRDARAVDALTPQEVQIARLVSTGLTSKEVAAQLFLSPRTIETHLRNIFAKLDISSRRQLRDVQLP